MSVNTKLIGNYLKSANNPYAKHAISGTCSDITDWVDTGSYAVNALLSGSIYGGYPIGRFTGLAGKSATGKTYFALQGVKEFLNKSEENLVFYFDSEGAVDVDMLTERGIDVNRFLHFPISTVEDFRSQILNLLEREHALIKEGSRTHGHILVVLDSLGMLASQKEKENARNEHNAADFTRSKTIRSTFRAVTLEMSLVKATGIVTNHTYDDPMSMHAIQEMAGGGGLKYAASNIIFLNKNKGFEATEKKGSRSGIRLRAVCAKGRKVIEESEVWTALSFTKGLARYYGLVDIALDGGVWNKDGKYITTDSGKHFQTAINKNPEAHFTDEVLTKVDAAAKNLFMYGGSPTSSNEDDDAEVEGSEE